MNRSSSESYYYTSVIFAVHVHSLGYLSIGTIFRITVVLRKEEHEVLVNNFGVRSRGFRILPF